LHDDNSNETYAAVPTNISWSLAFVKRDIRVENSNKEIKTVADIQARVRGIHKRRKTGMTRMPTAKETMISFDIVERTLLE